MPFFYYQRDFANRWRPKISRDSPKRESADGQQSELSPNIHSIPDHEWEWRFEHLEAKYPPPKDKPDG